jgi:hypothetical protein
VLGAFWFRWPAHEWTRRLCQTYQRVAAENGRDIKLDESVGAFRSVQFDDTEEEAADLMTRTNHTGFKIYFSRWSALEVDADQIVVIGDGRVVEAGTHHSLIAADGPYAKLWHARSHGRGRRLIPTGRPGASSALGDSVRR